MKLQFVRQDGKPFKILARGDCTSRRSVYMNADLFPAGFRFIQNQKAPAILFLDAHQGVSVTEEMLNEISDVSEMPKSLAAYYIGQADRSLLRETDADLIIIDSYAEMNFELWERIGTGEKLWIHPKYLRDKEQFSLVYKKLGRRAFDQSVNDIKNLVALLREKNPEVPVLFLNQQVDFYSKLVGRLEYYKLGSYLQKEIHNSYFGGVVDREDLLLADVGSCGPDQTLHFQAATYRRMLFDAFKEKEYVVNKSSLGASFSEEKSNIRFAIDNPNSEVYPEIEISLSYDSPFCTSDCAKREKEKIVANLQKYIYIDGVSKQMRWTPAIIEAKDYIDYAKWMTAVNKKYNRRYLMNRSVGKGYFFEEFHPKLFVPDMWEIHQSSTVRSGGAMRGAYTRSIDEMGGYPTRVLTPQQPKCNLHWGRYFGIFANEPGYRQGQVIVSKRLLAYISVRRIGDIGLYTQVMGHDKYLDDGVMYHLHFKIIEWLSNPDNHSSADMLLLMYGGVGNGGKTLWQWKNKVGFRPAFLVAA